MSDATGPPNEGGLEFTQTTRLTPGAVRALDQSAEVASRYWWLLLLAGFVGVVFGVVMLFNIWETLRVLAVLAGFYLLFTGVIELAHSSASKPRWLAIVAGLLAIAGGIVAMAYPGLTVAALTFIVGVSFIAWGVVKAVAAFGARGDGRTWPIIGGLLIALVGVITLVYPDITVVVISLLIGLNALVFGVSAIAQSLALRRAKADWEQAKLAGRPV